MNDLIKIENNKPIVKEKIINRLIELETDIKQLTELYDKYKRQLLEEMEKKNIVKISDETTGLSISYIPAQENLERFNKARLRDLYPDIYDECIDMNGKKSAYITIRR